MEPAVDFRALACAEFPNDNPGLHRGAIWFCAEPVAAPVFVGPEIETRCVEEPVVPTCAEEEPVVAAIVEPPTDPAPPVLEANDESDDIEIVEDLEFDAIDEAAVAECEAVAEADADADADADAEPESEPPRTDDPFLTLVRVLEEVALAAGAGDAAMTVLRTLLGQLRVDAGAPADHARIRGEALAWQGILRGESDDFAACGGGMLDEWSAALIATVLGNPARAETLKRELRRRGVAAFGLVDQAA
jgi:hypothetical protein